MNFTFGIITYAEDGVNDFLPQVVESIRALNIPEYEILIIGNRAKINENPVTSSINHDTRIIDFDEKIKPKWITKKKNLITDNAKFDNIVYQHDYLIYDENWYEGFKQFGDNFNVCINKITNPKANRENDLPHQFIETAAGSENRFRDLIFDMWDFEHKLNALGIDIMSCVIPYDHFHSQLSKFMYINGTYWVAKKNFMAKYRLNESLLWGQGEDVEWSRRVRKVTEFSFNPHSIVKLNKPGARIFKILTPEEIMRFRMSVGIN